MSKLGIAAVIGGGLVAAGAVVYLATRDTADGGPLRPRGLGGARSLGDVIARVGGSAVAEIGDEIGSWAARALRQIFGQPVRQDAKGPAPVSTEIFV